MSNWKKNITFRFENLTSKSHWGGDCDEVFLVIPQGVWLFIQACEEMILMRILQKKGHALKTEEILKALSDLILKEF